MGRPHHTISFLSDLGVVDETVGVVTAIVRDLAPSVVMVHLTHETPSGDVRAGSLALARCIGYAPSGVVLVAVDAGVESGRPFVAIEVAGGEGVLVGPDNGVLAPAVAMAGGAERAVVLDRDEFHLVSPGGPLPIRDVLAPVAAHLCNGADLFEVGTPIDADLLLPGTVPLPRAGHDGSVTADVLHIDRVGNVQLDVGPDDLAPWGHSLGARLLITAGDVVRTAERVVHPGELGTGSVGLLLDPHGMLALALLRRSAADELQVAVGDHVTLAELPEADRGGVTTPVSMRPGPR